MTKDKKELKRLNLIKPNIFMKLGSFFLYIIAILVLPIIHHFMYGLKIKGKKNLKKLKNSGAIITPTHNVTMDCSITARSVCYPYKLGYFLTHEKNLNIPFVSCLMRMLRTFGLPDSLSMKRECFKYIENLLSQKKWVIIYPEGDLENYKHNLDSFKSGSFKFAVKINVPIIPVVYCYRKAKGVYKLLGRKRPLITGYILEPIYPNTSLPINESTLKLQEQCETLMNETFKKYNTYYYKK